MNNNRQIFTEADVKYLQSKILKKDHLAPFTDDLDLELANLEGHPIPSRIFKRPAATVVYSDPKWPVNVVEQYFDDISRSDGAEILTPRLTSADKFCGVRVVGDELEARYCLMLWPNNKKKEPIGYTIFTLTGSAGDDSEIYFCFTLDSVYVSHRHKGLAYGVSLAIHSGEIMAEIYEYLAQQYVHRGYKVNMALYSELMSVGGERCANLVANELVCARDSLIDLGGMNPKHLGEIVKDMGF